MLILQPSPVWLGTWALLNINLWGKCQFMRYPSSWNCSSSSPWRRAGTESTGMAQAQELLWGQLKRSPSSHREQLLLRGCGRWLLAPGKLEFPALFILNPSDALLRGWKLSWVAGEGSSCPSSRSFLWSKQTVLLFLFPPRAGFINKSLGFGVVFVNSEPSGCVCTTPATVRPWNVQVQVPLFSFYCICDFPPRFQKRYSKIQAGGSKLLGGIPENQPE